MDKVYNIPRDTVDPYYRYKRPAIKVAVMRTYTQITNIEQVCKSIDRPVNQLIKYLGISFGCNSKGDRLYMKSEGIESQIDACVENYIQTYVLCGVCDNPETVILTNKKGESAISCKACGSKTIRRLDPKVIKC